MLEILLATPKGIFCLLDLFYTIDLFLDNIWRMLKFAAYLNFSSVNYIIILIKQIQ